MIILFLSIQVNIILVSGNESILTLSVHSLIFYSAAILAVTEYFFTLLNLLEFTTDLSLFHRFLSQWPSLPETNWLVQKNRRRSQKFTVHTKFKIITKFFGTSSQTDSYSFWDTWIKMEIQKPRIWPQSRWLNKKAS